MNRLTLLRNNQAEQMTIPYLGPQSAAPFVTLPLGASDDRLVGSLNIETALQHGERQFELGLLAQAHQGILYVDEVNLLADHLVDVLLDVAASGVNIVEREGVSVSHPAQYTSINTRKSAPPIVAPTQSGRLAMKPAAAPSERDSASVKSQSVGMPS